MFSKTDNPVALNIFSARTINLPDPGGGNPLLWICPANSRILIHSIKYDLTVMFANIFPRTLIYRGPGEICGIAASSVAPNALTITGVNLSTGFVDSNYRAADNFLSSPLPTDLFLGPGDQLLLTTVAMGVNIILTNVYVSYHQWIIA